MVGAVARARSRPAVLSPGRAQWRLLCVRAQAGGGGGSARALAGTRMREPRLISDRGVVCGSAQRGGTRLETLLAWRVSAFTAGAAWIPVWRTRRHPVFACLRASGGTRPRNVGGGGAARRGGEGVAFAWGNGGGLFCVVLGGAVAHSRGTAGPGRARAWKGGWNWRLVFPGFLPQAFSLQPRFRRVRRPGAAAGEAAFPEWKVL